MKNKGESPAERCLLEKYQYPAFTNPRYGCAPENRAIEEYIQKGVVNIDKPSGPTSHEVTAWVKKILGVNKAAHTGTLDPKVSGVLPILLGVATKLADVFVGDKEYVCLMRLHKEVEEDAIRKISKEFTGKLYQRVPLKSAVKQQIRIRSVHYVRIMEMEGRNVLMKVGCEAGTYIRMLCHHIGLALGVGAHMSQLRRTKSFPFSEGALTTLQDLKDAYVFYEEGDEDWLRKRIMPMEYALGRVLFSIMVKDSAVDALCHGADLAAPGISKVEEGINRGSRVVIYTLKGEAVSIGRAKMSTVDILAMPGGICVETEKVFMAKGTYPRRWRSKSKSKAKAEVAEW